MVRRGKAITVCPEILGGLPTPRPSLELQGGNGYDVHKGKARVKTADGLDVTEEFCKGAEIVLALARELQPSSIILKEVSPSCGSNLIRDGSYTGNRIPGIGVTAALLKQSGFKVVSSEQFKNENQKE
jgi:uncharacterized protein YbbK (DUF523 family)